MTSTETPIARFIDHTLLWPDASRSDVERVCDEALEYGFAMVCVNPCWVETASGRLSGTGVGVSAVVGFPLGATLTGVKVAETQAVLAAGATEIDMVMNLGAVKTGDWSWVHEDLQAVVSTCRAAGAGAKVIIEAALLTEMEKIEACTLAKDAGATFVKTATGFGPGGATVEDVALMRRVVGGALGVKAAGGVRDLATARAMIDAGATRIGSSAGVRIAQAERDVQRR